MRTFIIVLFISLFTCNVSWAGSRVTSNTHAWLCTTKRYAEELQAFQVANDKASWVAYLTDPRKCFLIKPGKEFTVVESPGFFGSIAGVVFEGTRFWMGVEGYE